jgi:cytochrome c-type biogenesis protein CcmH/NrfG
MAAHHYETALRKDPSRGERLHALLARIYTATGNADQAAKHTKRAARLEATESGRPPATQK